MNYVVYSEDASFGNVEKASAGNFETLSISHGDLSDGTTASYAYAMLPNSTEEEVQACIEEIEIISQNDIMHAVRNKNNGKIMANVFVATEDAPVQLGNVLIKTPCSVIIDGTNVYVSDPTQKLDVIKINDTEIDVSKEPGATYKITI